MNYIKNANVGMDDFKFKKKVKFMNRMFLFLKSVLKLRMSIESVIFDIVRDFLIDKKLNFDYRNFPFLLPESVRFGFWCGY